MPATAKPPPPTASAAKGDGGDDAGRLRRARPPLPLACGLSNYPGVGLRVGLREWLATELARHVAELDSSSGTSSDGGGRGTQGESRSSAAGFTPCTCTDDGGIEDEEEGKEEDHDLRSNITAAQQRHEVTLPALCWCSLPAADSVLRVDAPELSRLVQVLPLPLR